MRLLLFDIDGTLLRAGGIVREAMGEALAQVFGTKGRIADASFIGATDLGVVRSLMSEEGFSLEEIDLKFPKLIEIYGPILKEKLATWENFRLCPGVPEILKSLEDRGALLGLVTGNCQVGAFTKLDRGSLTKYFGFGAFGDETTDRAALCRYAHQRAEAKHGNGIPKGQVIMVGDSPNDIRAAHAYGIRILALSSGWTPAEDLEVENPTWLYPDMSATEEILGLLLS